MDKVTLSIIIPVYNVEKYVDCCLRSIYRQDFAEDSFEVILVDDGSEDNSTEVIMPYVEMHTNCNLYNQPHQGLSEARNFGLKKSVGEYVWFVDSDDYISDDSLQNVCDFCINKSNCQVMSTHLHWRFTDNTNDRIDGVRMFDNKEIDSYTYLLYGTLGATPRFIIKRSLLIENNLQFLAGALHEDSEFGYRLVYYAKKVYASSKSIYNYRQRNDGNITSTWDLKNTQSMLRIYKRANEFAEQIPEKAMRDVIFHKAFMILCIAFPLEKIKRNPEVHELYIEYIDEYRKEAIKLIQSSIPLKKKLKAMACLISPLFMKKVMTW